MPASIDPDVALASARQAADVYRQGVDDLLVAVARRLERGIDDPTGWAETKLAELTALRTEAADVVKRLEVEGPAAIRRGVARGAGIGVELARLDLGTAFVGTNLLAVDAFALEAVQAATDATTSILRTTEDVYRRIIAEASAPGVIVGSASRRQAAQRALDRFADRGLLHFTDRAGRRWEIESYIEMATRTASGRAMVAGTLDRFQAAGRDLVIVSDAPQECSVCRPWEGRVLSISGASAGRVLDDGVRVAGTVADARAAGLLHANCRHALGAYVPGLTQPFEHTADPEGDAARQEQRRLERGVRHWRRRELTALDGSTRARAQARRRMWQDRLEQHVAEHDLKRLRYREAPRLTGRPGAPPPPRPRPGPEPHLPTGPSFGPRPPAGPDLSFDVDVPSARARAEARLRALADEHGLEVDELRRARSLVDEYRTAARTAARREADDLFETIDQRWDAGRLRRPPRATVRRSGPGGRRVQVTRSTDGGGEYDWLERLDPVERRRVGRWFGDEGAALVDQLPERMGDPGLPVDDAVARWLEATRRHDALRSLASGRVPRYFDNVDDLVPDLAGDGIDVARLFGDPDDAAVMIARMLRHEQQDVAQRVLGSVRYVEGPPPWRLTSASYRDELIDVEQRLREARLVGRVDEVARRRWEELVPDLADTDLDGNLLAPDTLWARYRRLAVDAGFDR